MVKFGKYYRSTVIKVVEGKEPNKPAFDPVPDSNMNIMLLVFRKLELTFMYTFKTYLMHPVDFGLGCWWRGCIMYFR